MIYLSIQSLLTPNAGKEHKDIVCRLDLRCNSENAHDDAAYPADCRSSGRKPSTTNDIRHGDDNDRKEDVDSRCDACDLERVLQAGLLEEVRRITKEDTEADKLLRHQSPAGDDCSETISTPEDGVPLLSVLLGGNLAFVLDVDEQKVVLMVNIKAINSPVDDVEGLLGFFCLALGGKPGWRLWDQEIDDEHETDLGPLGIDWRQVVGGIFLEHDLEGNGGEKLSENPPEAVCHEKHASNPDRSHL